MGPDVEDYGEFEQPRGRAASELNDLLCVECSQLSGMTRNKANFLLAQNKALVGVIVMDINSGNRAYVEAGAVRWLSIKGSYKLMHPNAPDYDCDLHT